MRKKHALAAHNALVATADVIAFRPTDGDHAAIAHIAPDQTIFRQGEPCDAVFYLRAGAAKVHVLSKSGREAVIIILGPGEFFGEGAMLDDTPRICSVTAITPCTVERIESAEAWRRLREDADFARIFMDFVITRSRRYLVDLSGHHFYSTEKRLARALLRLPKVGDAHGTRLPRISQETLAEMIGTNRSRVNYFMNKFRRLGMIDYRGRMGDKLTVRPSLAAILRED